MAFQDNLLHIRFVFWPPLLFDKTLAKRTQGREAEKKFFWENSIKIPRMLGINLAGYCNTVSPSYSLEKKKRSKLSMGNCSIPTHRITKLAPSFSRIISTTMELKPWCYLLSWLQPQRLHCQTITAEGVHSALHQAVECRVLRSR